MTSAERNAKWYKEHAFENGQKNLDKRIREGGMPTAASLKKYKITREYINNRRAEADPKLPPLMDDRQMHLARARASPFRKRVGRKTLIQWWCNGPIQIGPPFWTTLPQNGQTPLPCEKSLCLFWDVDASRIFCIRPVESTSESASTPRVK